jgi:hypothetical protein
MQKARSSGLFCALTRVILFGLLRLTNPIASPNILGRSDASSYAKGAWGPVARHRR